MFVCLSGPISQERFQKIKIPNGQLRAVFTTKFAQLQYNVNFHQEPLAISTFSKIIYKPTKGNSTGAIIFMLRLKMAD